MDSVKKVGATQIRAETIAEYHESVEALPRICNINFIKVSELSRISGQRSIDTTSTARGGQAIRWLTRKHTGESSLMPAQR